MELSERVVSLELAGKLKKLSIPQNSYWYWYKDYKNNGYLTNKLDEEIHPSFVSAFTVAELGEMLPRGFYTMRDAKGDFSWFCTEKTVCDAITDNQLWAGTEADARAKMLIYLIENKHIKVEDL